MLSEVSPDAETNESTPTPENLTSEQRAEARKDEMLDQINQINLEWQES